MPANNINQSSEYTLLIHLAEQRIGTLTLDKGTNLLKLEYEQDWQQTGFPLSPALTLDNVHSPEVAYNYLDNALPEGEARKLLSEHLGVTEKNVYSHVRAIGNDLAGAISFKASEHGTSISSETSKPHFRVIEPDELTKRLASKEDIGLLIWDDKPRLSVAGVQDKLNIFINEQGQIGFGDG